MWSYINVHIFHALCENITQFFSRKKSPVLAISSAIQSFRFAISDPQGVETYKKYKHGIISSAL